MKIYWQPSMVLIFKNALKLKEYILGKKLTTSAGFITAQTLKLAHIS